MYAVFQKSLLLFFLLGMHFFMPSPGGDGLYLPFNVVSWIFVAVFIAIGLWHMSQEQKIKINTLHWFMLIGFIFLLIPIFYDTPFTDFAIPRLIGLALILILLFGINQFSTNDEVVNNQQHNQILLLILIGIAVSTLIGLYQLFFITEGTWLGYKPGSSRPHGNFVQPNVMASLLVTGIIIASYLFTAKVQLLAYWQKLLIISILFSAALLITILQSRTGFLGLALAMVCLFPYAFKHQKKHLLLVFVILGLGVTTAHISKQNIETPIRSSDIYSDAGARTDIYRVAGHMIMTEPLTGFGYGGFERKYREFHLRLINDNPTLPLPLENLTHPHNEVLYWGVEGGLIAILGLFSFATGFLFLFAHSKLINSLRLISLIIPILLHTQTEYPFYHSLPHLIIFCLLIHVIQLKVSKYKTQPFQATFLIKSFALVNLIITIPFMITTLQNAYLMNKYLQSDSTKVEYLRQIINPLPWKSFIESQANNHALLIGFTNHDSKALKRYIDWGREFVKANPEKSVYQNMITAIRILQKAGEPLDEAISIPIVIEASFLYPDEVDWDVEKAELNE